MYSRSKEEGIYDPGEFDWSSAEGFFEQRKYPQTDSPDSGTWRGWSDELDSVSADIILFSLLPDASNTPGLTFRPSLIQISTTLRRTCPTFFASSDYRLLRCTNISSVGGES